MNRQRKNQSIVEVDNSDSLSESNDSDDSDFSANFARNHTMNKQKVGARGTKGKSVQKITNSNRTNLPKRSRPKGMNGEREKRLSKKKKITQNDDQENRKGARERTRTNRYGSRESTANFNDFFH